MKAKKSRLSKLIFNTFGSINNGKNIFFGEEPSPGQKFGLQKREPALKAFELPVRRVVAKMHLVFVLDRKRLKVQVEKFH